MDSEILLSSHFHSCFLVPVGSSPLPWMFYIPAQKWCFKLPSFAVLFHCCHRARGRNRTMIFRKWSRCDKKPKVQRAAAGEAPAGAGAGGGRCPLVPSLCSLLPGPSGHHEQPRALPGPASLTATGKRTFLSRAADLEKIRGALLVPSRALGEFVGVLQSKSCLRGSVPFPHIFGISLLSLSDLICTKLLKSDFITFLHCFLSLPNLKSFFISGIQWELKKPSPKFYWTGFWVMAWSGEKGNLLALTEQWMSFSRISKCFAKK